jgi:hypothetical protein
VPGRQKFKDERAKHLEAIGAQPLPLPSPRREQPIPYSDDLPDEAVDLGACGLSDMEIAAHWSIDFETLKGWAEAHNALKDALSRARTAAQGWWEEKARRALELRDNRFPAGAWAMVVKARFGEYRDRVEINGSIDLVHKLVRIEVARPELLGEQMSADAKPLIEGESVRLPASQTVESEASDQAQRTPADPE